MSSLAFHSRTSEVRLPGRQVHAILGLARFSLEVRLSRARHYRVCAGLGLPDPDSPFFGSQLLELMGDGRAHHVGGHDVYLMDLALQVMYEQVPVHGILCWLFDNALTHGWVAAADRPAIAAEIRAVLDGGPPVLDQEAWGSVIAFLGGGEGDVVTSLAMGDEFPGWRLAWESAVWRPSARNEAEPGDELETLWGQLSPGDQWDLGMKALAGTPERQWHPGRYRFSDITLGNAPGGLGGLVPSGPDEAREPMTAVIRQDGAAAAVIRSGQALKEGLNMRDPEQAGALWAVAGTLNENDMYEEFCARAWARWPETDQWQVPDILGWLADTRELTEQTEPFFAEHEDELPCTAGVAFALFVLAVLGQELTMADLVKILLKAGLMAERL